MSKSAWMGSDERMAKFKAAVDRCRNGDLGALFGVEISHTELITIKALAKLPATPSHTA